MFKKLYSKAYSAIWMNELAKKLTKQRKIVLAWNVVWEARINREYSSHRVVIICITDETLKRKRFNKITE